MDRAEPATVLLVSYHFPPRGGVAAQRAVKFARYLPRFGWRPVILTSTSVPFNMRDDDLLAELPADLRIVRVPMLNLDGLTALARRRLAPLLSRRIVRGARRKPSIRARGRWLLVPDDKLTWLPLAVWHGLRLIRRHGVSVIYSTSPPATAHLIGWWLSRLSRRPWVADFRDPWHEDAGGYVPTSWHGRQSRAMQRAVITTAGVVSATTDALAAHLRRAHPDLPAGHFITLTNGFDPEDFKDARPRQATRFSFVHAGTFKSFAQGPRRTPVYFLQALRMWMAQEPDRRPAIQVDLLGTAREYLEPLVETLELSDVVQVRGFVTHRETVAHLLSAGALVLIMGADEQTTVPAKLYEYLAAGRPILALAPDGPAADLIKESGRGVVVSPQDHCGVGEAMKRLSSGVRLPDQTLVLERFTRREITRQLAEQLNRMTASASSAWVHSETALDR